MLIAVASDGRDLDSPVSGTLETCRSLLIVNMETGEIRNLKNPGDPLGVALAGIIVEEDCEAVIAGGLSPEAFGPIADACVMERNRLKLIRNPENTDACDSHHESSCDECGH